jgi:hypothetical protein
MTAVATNLDESVVRQIAGRVNLPTQFKVEVGRDSMVYIQILCWRKDIVTDEIAWGSGGKRYLSAGATTDAIVRTIFSAYIAYQEHECRETFLFDGERIFGPHISVKALKGVASQIV